MNRMLHKVFDPRQLRYAWLLAVSMALFLLALLNHRAHPQLTAEAQVITYGAGLFSAFVWSGLNYLDHLKINALYQRQDDIAAYVNSLAMPRDEQEELQAYLQDFAADLVSQGKSREEAVQTAISHFMVREFTAFEGGKGLFELPAHHYLLGGAIALWTAAGLVQGLVHLAYNSSFGLKATSFIFMLYGGSFIILFFLYKLFDAFVRRKTGGAQT